MEGKKYEIKYTEYFIKQFNNILTYIIDKLDNRIAAENLYYDVIKEIEKRSSNPEAFEKYISAKKRKDTYYRIYVKNYVIFYVVRSNCMEVRRILYSRMNFKGKI